MADPRARRSHSIAPGGIAEHQVDAKVEKLRRRKASATSPRPTKRATSPRAQRSQLEKFSSFGVGEDDGRSRKLGTKSHFVSPKERRQRRKKGASHRKQSTERIEAARVKLTSSTSGGTLPRGTGNQRPGIPESRSSCLSDSSKTSSSRHLGSEKKRHRRPRKDHDRASELRKQKLRKEIIAEITALLCADCKTVVASQNETAAQIAKEWKDETDKVTTILKRLKSQEGDDLVDDDNFWDEDGNTFDDYKESGEISTRGPGGGVMASAVSATPDDQASVVTVPGGARKADSMGTEEWAAIYGDLTPEDVERSRGGHVRDGWHLSPDGKTMSLLGLPPIPLGRLSPGASKKNNNSGGNEGTSLAGEDTPPPTRPLDPERAAAEERRRQQEARDAQARAGILAKRAKKENGEDTVEDVIGEFMKNSEGEDFSLAQNPLHARRPSFVACVLRPKEGPELEFEVRQLSQRLNEAATALSKLNKASPVLPPPAVVAYLDLVGVKTNSPIASIEDVGKVSTGGALAIPYSSKPVHKRSRSNTDSAHPLRKGPASARKEGKAGKSKKKKHSKAIDIRGGSSYLLGASIDSLCSDIHDKAGLVPPTLGLLVTFLSKPDVLATPGLFTDLDESPPELDEKVELLNEALAGVSGCNLDEFGATTVAAFFLRFFLELQEPLLPFGNYAVAMKAPNIEDRQFRISALHSVVMSLPPKRRLLLTCLICWCELVLSRAESNNTSKDGLATRFGPLVVRPPFTQWLRPAKNRALLRVATARSGVGHKRKVSNAEDLAAALSLAPHARGHAKPSKANAEGQSPNAGENVAEPDASVNVDADKEGEDLEKALRQYGKPSIKFFLALLENSNAIFHSFPEYGAWQEEQKSAARQVRNKLLDPKNKQLNKVSAEIGKTNLVSSWVIDDGGPNPGEGREVELKADAEGGDEIRDKDQNGDSPFEGDLATGKTEAVGVDEGPPANAGEKGDSGKEKIADGLPIGMIYAPVNVKTAGKATGSKGTEEKGGKFGESGKTGPDLDTPRVVLQAATVRHIVEKMMDGVYIQCVEKGFDRMVIATHRYFASPAELLEQVFAVLIGALEADVSGDGNAWIRTQGRRSALDLIETWMRDYAAFATAPLSCTDDFEAALESGLSRLVEIFGSTEGGRTGPNPLEVQCDELRSLWKLQKRKERSDARQQKKKEKAKAIPTFVEGKLKGLPTEDSLGKNALLALEPEEIAQALTHRAVTLFSNIPHQELVGLRFQDPHSEFAKSTIEYNTISFWVGTQVLLLKDPQHRAKVLSHFIQIAIELRKLGNFDTLSAIVSGLQNTPVERLEASWKLVKAGLKKKFLGLKELTDPALNFAQYRREFARRDLPKLPVLAVLSTDLIATHEQKSVLPAPAPSPTGTELVNVDKLRATYSVLDSQFVRLGFTGTLTDEDRPYTGCLEQATKDVLKKLAKQLSPSVIAGERELFDASKRAEPRK